MFGGKKDPFFGFFYGGAFFFFPPLSGKVGTHLGRSSLKEQWKPGYVERKKKNKTCVFFLIFFFFLFPFWVLALNSFKADVENGCGDHRGEGTCRPWKTLMT